MKEDDEVCLCFHVSRRKVTQFIRVQRPVRVSQLSQCFGAGTGCGWCRPFLKRLFESEIPEHEDLPDATDYSACRLEYRRHNDQ